MMSNIKHHFLWLCAGILLLWSACTKNDYYDKGDALLSFSTDTLMFDTVFTNIGSTTRYILVYNPYNSPIRTDIRLGRDDGQFRLNIDGVPTNNAEDVVIRSKDSLFIFVEVTVNPNDKNSPILILDSLIFDTNGNRQDVKLAAYGQDVHLINDEYVPNQTWVNDKPYLIYNSMAIDSNQTLTIGPGCRIYSHNGSAIYVWGRLDVFGECDSMVVFQGDRIDNQWLYSDGAGQWHGIWFFSTGSGNINNAKVLNATIGITAGELEKTKNTVLTLNNVHVENASYAGLFAVGSRITATNCVFANSGTYCVALFQGGNYEFVHCTVANYWPGKRQQPSVGITNFVEWEGKLHTAALSAYFGNCIIYGAEEGELGFDFSSKDSYKYTFEHCLLKVNPKDVNVSDTAHFANIKQAQFFRFKNISKHDYSLDTLSIAKDAGSKAITNRYPDILQNDAACHCRTCDKAPDLGAFERDE